MKSLLIALAIAPAAAAQPLTEDRVLLLYNSENAESQAVRDAYVAVRPGVLEFDFDNPNLSPGALTRGQFNNRVRDPLRAHLMTTDATGQPLAERVIAIATTRGLPARVNGAGEFTLASQRASLESEISLVFQDLDAAGSGSLATQYSGAVDNPYHMSSAPVASFSRANIQTAIPFTRVFLGGENDAWRVDGLTPGDFYLACRLDAGASETTTALEETIALINRSASPAQMSVSLDCVQALLDEYEPGGAQLDNDGIPPLFPEADDFDRARSALIGLGVATTHDQTRNFVTGPELAGEEPLLVLGTYGENHDIEGRGDNPPGAGTYLNTYTPHPAGVVVTYESFSGNCLVTGTQRQNQACATDWIARGGSFAIPTVAEPFTFGVADLEAFVPAMYANGMTFAEAAYMSIPALSWQNTPVGDPLARVTIGAGTPADLTGDGQVNSTDLAVILAAWGTPDADLDGDGTTGSADLAIVLAAWGAAKGC